MPLWVREYDSCGYQGNNHLPIANEHGGGTALKTHSVAVGGSSIQSPVFLGTTVIVSLQSDENCWVSVGANPTAAVGTDIFIPSGQLPFYLGVRAGLRLAVITGA